MSTALLYGLIAVLVLAAPPAECPRVDFQRPIPGHLLLEFSSREDLRPAFACRVEGAQQPVPVPTPAAGHFAGVNWGATPSEILVSGCDAPPTSRGRCHIERMTLDGTLVRTYPELPVREFQESDGRLSPGGARTPAHMSPGGEYLAASANGRSPALLRASDGQYVVGLTDDNSEASWSPDGTRLAFTAAPNARKSAFGESQVFVYDLRSARRTQLTHFEPESSRPWWNPFASPVVRSPLVAGLSWARRADVIAFYLAPERGVFLVDSQGTLLRHLNGLEGRCWRQTQLSADAEHLLYLSASVPDLCLLNGGDEIRVVNSDGSDDHVALSVRDLRYVITRVDWRTD